MHLKLDKSQFEWLVYDECYQIGQVQFIKRCTLVSSLTVCLFAGPFKINERILRNTEKVNKTIENNLYESNFKLDNWIEFYMSRANFESLLTLRQKLNLNVLRLVQLNIPTKSDEVVVLKLFNFFKK